MPLNYKKAKHLAWMPPGVSRTKQILAVANVPHYPNREPTSSVVLLASQQQPAKLHRLLKKATDLDPAAPSQLLSKLNSLGLVQDSKQVEAESQDDLHALVLQLVEGSPELQSLLKAPPGEYNLEEVEGARELLDNLELEDWLQALEVELEGPNQPNL